MHPSFPQPKDQSALIWRYMDIDKFSWMTEWGRLYMPSADQLGDGFEGTTPLGDLKWWAQLTEDAENEEQKSVYQHNRRFLSKFAEKFRNHYYLSCWHMNEYENLAMWKCYTRTAEAVAIKTTYSALRDALPQYVEMGMVRYIDYDVDRLPTLNLFEYIMHKRTYFSFEREARAVAFPPPVEELGLGDFCANLFEREQTPSALVFAPPVDLKQLIHGVVLHPESDSAFMAQVTDVCARLGLPVPETSRQNRTPQF